MKIEVDVYLDEEYEMILGRSLNPHECKFYDYYNIKIENYAIQNGYEEMQHYLKTQQPLRLHMKHDGLHYVAEGATVASLNVNGTCGAPFSYSVTFIAKRLTVN